MAAILILSIIAVTTAALSSDQKAEMRQIALAVATSELNRFAKQVALAGSSARSSFWTATDSGTPEVYAGPGTIDTIKTSNTDFALTYYFQTVQNASGSGTLGDGQPENRLRKVDLIVQWWGGEQGKPGYGKLSVQATRLIRESDLREPF